MLQEYPNGYSGSEDACQRVTYTYDTNPVNSSFSQNSYGRMTTKQYGCGVWNIQNGVNWGQYSAATYVEMYSYHQAGPVTAKQFVYNNNYYDPSGQEQTASGNLEADYTFDTWGRVATLLNPANPMQYQSGTDQYGNPIMSPCATAFTYDSIGRLSGITGSGGSPCNYSQVYGVQYDYASRLTSMQTTGFGPNGNITGSATETRSYNASGQLSSMNGIQYAYPATQNDGQITQAVDAISGETIIYQYDALKRLISASSSPTSGSTPAAWTQTFQYDGFGNLTGKVLNGTTTSLPVNAATNRELNASYDANGNMLVGTYDAENRLVGSSGGTYTYAPDNKRILRQLPNGSMEFTFYGAASEKLGVFSIVPPDAYHQTFQFLPLGMTLSFGGRVVIDRNVALLQDRLGTNRTGGSRYYPYGEEITATSNDREKFGTYTRDAATGLDYADQRFYASSYGRFATPEPGGRANSGDPRSWNQYSYTNGDPVNFKDSRGLYPCLAGYGPDGVPDITDCEDETAYIAPSNQYSCLVAMVAACVQVFQAFQAQQAVVAQARAQAFAVLGGLVKNAVDRAVGDLMSPDCAGLFGAGPFGDVGDPTNTPGDALDSLESAGKIRVATFDPTDGGPAPGVGAVTQNDGTIYIAANRYFFSGIDQNGASVLTNPNSVFNGMTMSQMQETILIHELLHSTGVVGADNAGQMIMLGNGQVVQGSAGVTAAVKANCIH